MADESVDEGVGVSEEKAEAARVRLDILSSYINSLFVSLEVSRQLILRNGSQTESKDGQPCLSPVVGQTGVQIYRRQGGGLGRAATYGSHRFVYSCLTNDAMGLKAWGGSVGSATEADSARRRGRGDGQDGAVQSLTTQDTSWCNAGSRKVNQHPSPTHASPTLTYHQQHGKVRGRMCG